MNHYLLLIVIMAGMGILGGIINFFTLYNGEKHWVYFFFQNIFVGLGGAALVPLLLKTAASDLLTEFGTGTFARPDYFLLAGFCLVAALVARVFVRSDPPRRRQSDDVPKRNAGETNGAILRQPGEQAQPNGHSPRSRPVSGKPAGANAEQPVTIPESPDLSKDAQHVVATLKQPDYVFKSIGEIRNEVDISRSYLELILERLEASDMVTTIERDDDVFWGLTYKGYSYNSH